MPVAKVSETAVSNAVQALMNQLGGFVYSLEAGALGHWDSRANGGKGKFIVRPGGTRTTPGFPDLWSMISDPFPYELTTECKGTDTEIKDEQWRFTLRASLFGHPSLIVRSQEEWLTGMRFLGLFPERWVERPPFPHDWSAWPQNVNYLADMRRNFWKRHDSHAPAYRLPDDPPVNNRRRKPPFPEL